MFGFVGRRCSSKLRLVPAVARRREKIQVSTAVRRSKSRRVRGTYLAPKARSLSPRNPASIPRPAPSTQSNACACPCACACACVPRWLNAHGTHLAFAFIHHLRFTSSSPSTNSSRFSCFSHRRIDYISDSLPPCLASNCIISNQNRHPCPHLLPRYSNSTKISICSCASPHRLLVVSAGGSSDPTNTSKLVSVSQRPSRIRQLYSPTAIPLYV